MTSHPPPPVPPEAEGPAGRPDWRGWLPWTLLAVAVVAGIGVGVWQAIVISDLRDDNDSLEAQLAGSEATDQQVSAQAKSSRERAAELKKKVGAQGASITKLENELESSQSSLASARRSLASEESTDQELRSSLATVKQQLDSAEAAAGEVATCHRVVAAGSSVNTDVAKAVGELEGAIRAEQGSPAERRDLAAALRQLENAEATWKAARGDVSACS